MIEFLREGYKLLKENENWLSKESKESLYKLENYLVEIDHQMSSTWDYLNYQPPKKLTGINSLNIKLNNVKFSGAELGVLKDFSTGQTYSVEFDGTYKPFQDSLKIPAKRLNLLVIAKSKTDFLEVAERNIEKYNCTWVTKHDLEIQNYTPENSVYCYFSGSVELFQRVMQMGLRRVNSYD